MRKHIALAATCLMSLVLISLGGCSTTGGGWGGEWGAGATLMPGWNKVKQSALNAAKDPHTWVPLIAALAFGIDDFDQQTVDWASEHTPLFGGIEDAEDASDVLKDLSGVNYLITALAAPSGPGSEGISNKAHGLGIGILAIAANSGLSNAIKSASDRKRPDKQHPNGKDNSFPSLHASHAAIAARLASRNIEHIRLREAHKDLWQCSSYTLAGLSAWARVEGKRHYPSDVLAGYALGNFLGAFVNDAFITPGYRDELKLSVYTDRQRGIRLGLAYRW